jgi:hypothetical protein
MLLRDAVVLAESGQFDAALRVLMDHDAAVRSACVGVPAQELPRWRVLLEAQQRAADRLVALRDQAGREVSRVGRARRVAEAYDAAS